MTTLNPAQAGTPTGPFAAWRTRDILLAAIIGVVFGVVFAIWNGIYGGLDSLTKPLGRHFCVGCHPGHSGVPPTSHQHAERVR